MTQDLLTREEIEAVMPEFATYGEQVIGKITLFHICSLALSYLDTLADSKTPQGDPEKGLAIKVANIILDDARRHPDSTESMLSRQFLRSLEEKHSKTPQGWQPIETVPSTAELVLFWNDRFYIGRGDDYRHRPIYLIGSTHWQPLPSPPTLSAKE